MPDLLIRGLGKDAKRALAVRAARNGRSQQAEARAILEATLGDENRGWTSLLYDAARSVGGVELELPERHEARDIDVEGWK